MRPDHFIADYYSMQVIKRRESAQRAFEICNGYMMTKDEKGEIARELGRHL